jgi:hypothetical protein
MGHFELSKDNSIAPIHKTTGSLQVEATDS